MAHEYAEELDEDMSMSEDEQVEEIGDTYSTVLTKLASKIDGKTQYNELNVKITDIFHKDVFIKELKENNTILQKIVQIYYDTENRDENIYNEFDIKVEEFIKKIKENKENLIKPEFKNKISVMNQTELINNILDILKTEILGRQYAL